MSILSSKPTDLSRERRADVRPPVNPRSVTLGLLGVIVLCAITPYNDFAVNNTYFIGSYLPTGVVLLMSMLILLVNAPLRRRAPRRALSTGELTTVLGMLLVACSLPSSGMMRYLPICLNNIWYHGGQNADFARVLDQLNLPEWMFPTFATGAKSTAARAADPVVTHFYGRVPVASDSFDDRFVATPWRAWLRPMLAWGLFVGAMYGAILCLSLIMRRQWTENERLSFPLAHVWQSLIEAPPPGRAANALFRSRGFWIAFGFVFAIHLINGGSDYFPRFVPKIPLRYDLTNILTAEPWRDLSAEFKAQTLYFAVVGIMFFVQTRVSFSLWFFYVAFQLIGLSVATRDIVANIPMQTDQLFGGAVAFALMIVWIGRRHWAMVLRHMLRPPRDRDGHEGEPRGKFLSHRLAGWGLVACVIAMCIWLVAAGMTVVGAIVLVLIVLTLFMLVARIIAETGLIFAQLDVPPLRPWVYLLNDLPVSVRTTGRNYFFSAFFQGAFTRDVRETFSVFATHAIRVADESAYPDTPPASSSSSSSSSSSRQHPSRFIAALILALLIGYVTSATSLLYVEYAHASTLSSPPIAPINGPWASDSVPKNLILTPTRNMLPPNHGPHETHNRLGHFAIGAGLVAVLGALRLRFAAFPFHPIGFLMAYSYPMSQIAWSIFIGWLIKVIVLRFGGSALFRRARFVMTGLIFGDAAAAAFWLVVSLVLNARGVTYHPVRLFPE